MKPWAITTLVLLLISGALFAQETGYLRKKSNRRLKKLNPKTVFWFKTKSDTLTSFYQGRISNLNDSSITIVEYQKRGSTTPAKEILLKLDDIEYLSNPLFNSNDFSNESGWFFVAGALVLVCTPIVWAVEGKEDGKGTLIFAGMLMAVAGVAKLPPLIERKFYATRWELVRR